MVRSKLVEIGWIENEEITDTLVTRMRYCYPILETGSESIVREIKMYLSHFGNLRVVGRSGNFTYSWIHDAIRWGKETIDEFVCKL